MRDSESVGHNEHRHSLIHNRMFETADIYGDVPLRTAGTYDRKVRNRRVSRSVRRSLILKKLDAFPFSRASK